MNNNEFSVKYRILREQPNDNFLIYHKGPQPEDIQNWLLDVQLAQGEFRTDQVSIWLAELELGLEFTDVVQAHSNFYEAENRKDALKQLLNSDDTPGMIRLKILAVCAGAEPRMDAILENLLEELSENQDEKINLIFCCGLKDFLWDQMKRCYGYSSDAPGIQDFVIELFKSCYAMETDGTVKLTGDALVFLKRWKDSRQYESTFENLSNKCAELLNIKQDLSKRDFRKLIKLDYFQLIDRKIISDLVHHVAEKTISAGDCTLIARQRRQGHWYLDFYHLYNAVDVASQFIHTLDETQLSMESMLEGIQNYSNFWYRLDQLYRKFTYHVRRSGQTSLLESLSIQIENLYTNNYLLQLNDNWQRIVDATSFWCDSVQISSQKQFFNKFVIPIHKKNKKVFIIISDALRYEVGKEFLSLIRKEDRYEGQMNHVLSMIPSSTQLGMAALLPNNEIEFACNETGTTICDGQSTQGFANRLKILSQFTNKKITAIKSEDYMKLNNKKSRALTCDHDAIYIYHNRIDATGDKRDSEESVFEAVEETLIDLIKLVKKLTNANANNIIVTSDHGFIYQNKVIEESDFISNDVEGDEILYRNRRYILGKGMKENNSFKKFTSPELGLTGDIEVLIPKSINRIRVKGSGSRFVHGGASLQEVVIPIIQINKKRYSDIRIVEVELIRGSTTTITSGQLGVVFYQTVPSSDKVQPRNLKAGIYSQTGELISDSHDLTFDFVSENPREREQQVQFKLTRKADNANEQEVILRLDEKLTGTSHFREYISARYFLRRLFTNDFDF
ncbi:alkaline phosphatase [Candidatus Magnetomorum sp. HK-1]|nr:alkaline phosphatase [Candidatus Magnetomorum sp. HK-1]